MKLSAHQSRRYLLIPIPAVAAVAIGSVVATSALADAAALEWTLTDDADLGGYSLSDVEALARNDVWAVGTTKPNGVGDTVAIHWNGEKWEDTTPPKGTALQDVAAITGEICGLSEPRTTRTRSPLDGTGKPGNPYRLPSPTSLPTSGHDCTVWTVGGSSGMNYPGESTAFIQHWNGEKWSLMDVPLPDGAVDSTLDSVRVLAADDVWAVGQTLDQQGVISPLLLRWNGGDWSMRELVIPEAGINHITVTEDGRLWLAGAVYPDSDPFGGTRPRCSWSATGRSGPSSTCQATNAGWPRSLRTVGAESWRSASRATRVSSSAVTAAP